MIDTGTALDRHVVAVGGMTIAIECEDPVWATSLVEALDAVPEPVPTTQPDLVVRAGGDRPTMLDVQNPARDGTVTASDGQRRPYLITSGLWCSVPVPWEDEPIEISCARGFPIGVLVRRILLPALQVAMPFRRAVAIHATACAFGERGVVVAGWSESGKTEVALALCETGAGFVADKWTVLTADRELLPFPARVGIRGWVVPYLPALRRALPPLARAQLRTAALADAALTPARRAASPTGTAGRLFARVEQIRALGDRASLTRPQLGAIYPNAAVAPTLRTLAFLTVWDRDRVEARDGDVNEVARRLASTAAYERRDFFALHERANFADPLALRDARSLVASAEETRLRQLLSSVTLRTIRTPFPVDPRRVAVALGAA